MNSKKVKTRKTKQKKTKPKKKLVQISLLIVLLLLLIPTIGYFYTHKKDTPIQKAKIETKKQPIKKATNEEVMQEVLAELEAKKQHRQQILLKKDNIFENKPDINNKILQKVQEIKKDNENHQQTTQTTKENVPAITHVTNEKTSEKVEEKRDKKVEEKAATLTKQDKYVYNKKDKPRVAIIIDDVISTAQKNKILAIGYPVTMSFLPPTNIHKDSAKIAQNLPFYMIHFPLQATSSFKSEESNTLKTTDSYETIENRVKQLRTWYPNARYTNNHTGSVFTQNDEAMNKLYKALAKYNFVLVDSRTSPKSVAQKYSKQYNIPYIARNIFLDDDKNYQAIKSQLIKAIEMAKKQGYAVAIGHPQDLTLKVLKDSKSLFNDVEPVFINKLPYL